MTMTMTQIRDRYVAKPGCALPSTRLTSTFHLLSFAINTVLIVIIIMISIVRMMFVNDDCDCADTIRMIDAMVGMDKVKYGLKLSDSDVHDKVN